MVILKIIYKNVYLVLILVKIAKVLQFVYHVKIILIEMMIYSVHVCLIFMIMELIVLVNNIF